MSESPNRPDQGNQSRGADGGITIRIPTPLRGLAGGNSRVEVEGRTVGEALKTLENRFEGLEGRILTPDGRIRGFINVFVGETDVRRLEGLETRIGHGTVLAVLPAVAGGRR